MFTLPEPSRQPFEKENWTPFVLEALVWLVEYPLPLPLPHQKNEKQKKSEC